MGGGGGREKGLLHLFMGWVEVGGGLREVPASFFLFSWGSGWGEVVEGGDCSFFFGGGWSRASKSRLVKMCCSTVTGRATGEIDVEREKEGGGERQRQRDRQTDRQTG